MTFRYRHGDRPLDGYTIQRGVGRGGFGEVYYAVSDGGREVALKSILQNAEIELRGVRHCINLKSPHLVSIFDVKTGNQGLPWVIMEYIAGPSVRDILHEHPDGLGAAKAGYLAREIGRGLAYLHERGIVHRDLKPENIFYEDGYVKIGDYGLSKFISVSHQSGQTISVGTVHYMAPEIGSGNYSRGIDIYALGVIVYELLTGRLPFTGDSFGEILMKHLTAKPDLSAIEDPFRSVVTRALEKKPEDRYRTADDLVRDLLQNDDLSTSVAKFNHLSLSTAAHRDPADDTPLRVSPVAQTAAAGGEGGPGPTADSPPSPWRGGGPEPGRPNGAPREKAEPAAPGTRLKTPPPLPKAPAARDRRPAPPPPVVEAEVVAAPRSEPAPPAPFTASDLDPLDTSQRVARAFFVTALMTAGVTVVSGSVLTPVGFLLTVASGAASILLTQFYIAERFQIAAGFPRRLVAATLAALPASIGIWIATEGAAQTSPLAFLIALLVVDWRLRLKPTRDERISIGQAIYAGLAGLVLGWIFDIDDFHPAVVGASLATISLMTNAYAPFVPPAIRRRWKKKQTEEAAQTGRAAKAPPEAPPEPRKAAIVDDGIPYLHPAPAHAVRRRPAPLPARPPGPAAKGFWLFVAFVLTAGGLSFLITALLVTADRPQRADDEACAFLACGLGFLGYASFAFYRGLWARERTAWRRTLRPFLLSTSGTTMLITAAIPAWILLWKGRVDDEVLAICGGFFLTGLFLTLVVLALEALVRFGRASPVGARATPSSTWPVHPAARIFHALLGFSALALAATFALVGFAEGSHRGYAQSVDSLGFFLGAVGALTLAFFFGRQALRHQRGTVWQGTLRPFLLFVSTGAGTIFVLWLIAVLTRSFGFRHYDDDMVVGLAVGITISAVLGAFALFIRGKSTAGRDEARAALREHLVAHGNGDAAPGADGSVRPGWAGFGLLLWIVGIPLALADMAFRLDGLEYVSGVGSPDTQDVLRTLWVPCLVLGGLSVLISRWSVGFLHFSRALLGQAALIASCLTLSEGLSLIRLSQDLVIFASAYAYRGFVTHMIVSLVLAGLGILLLAWRQRQRNGTESAEVLGEV